MGKLQYTHYHVFHFCYVEACMCIETRIFFLDLKQENCTCTNIYETHKSSFVSNFGNENNINQINEQRNNHNMTYHHHHQ